jgi:Tol biopolymer transport system component
VTRDNALHAWPFVSTNGKKLAYASSQRKSWDIWLRDMETAKTVKLTAPPLNGVSPILDSTGSKVAFAQPFRQPGQKWPLYTLGTSGGGPEMICDDCGFPTSWSSDGRKLIYQMSPRGNPSWLDLTSRAKNPFLSHPTNSLWGASFSPDDRWVVFNAVTGEERSRIFVVPFSNGAIADQSVWIPITDGSSEDFNATWSPSGSVMYFSSQRDGYKCLWAQRLDLASKRPEGPSYPVLHLHSARYGILQVHQFRLSASQTGLFFNLGDLTGNIWMTRLPYR